jgi:hypothetical protein
LNALPICRIDLRPSRWLAFALLASGALAAGGLFMTNLPLVGAVMFSPVCLGWGAWFASVEIRRNPTEVVFRSDGNVEVDGARVADFRIDWQGPITRLQWRGNGRWTRVAAWPDVVDAGARRELRLWALAHRADASTAAVAP